MKCLKEVQRNRERAAELNFVRCNKQEEQLRGELKALRDVDRAPEGSPRVSSCNDLSNAFE